MMRRYEQPPATASSSRNASPPTNGYGAGAVATTPAGRASLDAIRRSDGGPTGCGAATGSRSDSATFDSLQDLRQRVHYLTGPGFGRGRVAPPRATQREHAHALEPVSHPGEAVIEPADQDPRTPGRYEQTLTAHDSIHQAALARLSTRSVFVIRRT
jgi:hypothetical protein